MANISRDGFIVRAARQPDGSLTVAVAANRSLGVTYGAFEVLRVLGCSPVTAFSLLQRHICGCFLCCLLHRLAGLWLSICVPGHSAWLAASISGLVPGRLTSSSYTPTRGSCMLTASSYVLTCGCVWYGQVWLASSDESDPACTTPASRPGTL